MGDILGELFEKSFARLGAIALLEYGVVGILSVLGTYVFLLSVGKLSGYIFERRGEAFSWLQARGQVIAESSHSAICAVSLLVAASSAWPYFAYVLLRAFVCGSSAYIASRLYKRKRVQLAWVAGVIAVLYNPVFPVRMARSDWQAVNLLTIIPFIAYPVYLSWGSAYSRRSRRFDQCRVFVRAAAAICTRMKGRDIRILEFPPTDSALSNYFVVTSAINHRQAMAIADEVKVSLKNDWDVSPISDNRNVGWSLLDYEGFVVHIFLKEQRAFYGIESVRKSAKSFNPEEFEVMAMK